MEKRAWEKPELIVIVRSKPEEAVLNGCKLAGANPPGPGSSNNNCVLPGGGRCRVDTGT